MQPTATFAKDLERPAARDRLLPERLVLRALMLRAVKVSCVVGTCLTLINQGDLLFGEAGAPALWWKIPLTYCVPFCVSLYSAIAAMRGKR